MTLLQPTRQKATHLFVSWRNALDFASYLAERHGCRYRVERRLTPWGQQWAWCVAATRTPRGGGR